MSGFEYELIFKKSIIYKSNNEHFSCELALLSHFFVSRACGVMLLSL